MSHFRSAFLCSLFWLGLLAYPLFAGSGTGSISGVVTDPQGQVIAGAKVTLRNADFGTTRGVTTDANGSFLAASLPAGTYMVNAEAAGFTMKKAVRVSLSTGSSVQLTVALGIARTSEQVTVTGRAPTVEGNTVSPAVNKQEVETGNFLAGLTVTYLPNRDRDFSQFGQLAAGTVSAPNTAGQIIAGQRPQFSKTEIDGADFNDPLQGGQRGSHDTALFFPQTVVREFEIVHAGATASVGGTNAGFLNIVTKEGSNKLHGEGFYIGRPATLTSRDAFHHSLDDRQNEFGGSLGGPIRKNRAFFYAGFEQDFLHVPYWTEFAAQAPGVAVPVSLLALQQQTIEKTNPSALFGRTDVILNPANTLSLEMNFNRLDATNLSEGSTRTLASPNHENSLDGDSEWLRANLGTVLGGKTVNQFLLAWSRDYRDMRPNDTGPEIFINGFGVLGGNSLSPQRYTSSRLEASEDITLSRGAAYIHFGGRFSYEPARLMQEANLNGRFDFNSLMDYLSLTPRRFRQTFVTADDIYDAAAKTLGIYVDARAPLGKTLTVSAGLRWDGQWNPQPDHPNPNAAQTARIPNDLKQWQPRLGLAWNPKTNTVVRISSGLYAAPTPTNIFQRIFTDNGINTVVADSYFDPEILPLVTVGGLHALSAPPAGLLVPGALVVGISPRFRNPESFQSSASLEQQLGRANVSVGYLRNSTWRLQRQVDENLFPPTISSEGLAVFPGIRPNPSIGRLLVNQATAHSSYDGLLVTATLQVNRRTQLTANYTLSRTRDDDSSLGPFGRNSALNPFDLRAEGAYSSFDARQDFNVSAVINLPLGFKVNPIVLARSGLPYTPIVGFDLQNDANDQNDRAILNGLEAPRNILRQPSFANLDLRFVKDITLRGEGHHLDLFLDVFNVTGASNRNFGAEAISYYGTAANPVYTAGQPLFAPHTNHFGGARQVQFTARIVAF